MKLIIVDSLLYLRFSFNDAEILYFTLVKRYNIKKTRFVFQKLHIFFKISFQKQKVEDGNTLRYTKMGEKKILKLINKKLKKKIMKLEINQ